MSDSRNTDTASPSDLGAYATGKVNPELPDWWPDPAATPICEHCGRPFPSLRPETARYCKPACRAAAWREAQK